MYVCMYVCTYACMHACMHACMYAMYRWGDTFICMYRWGDTGISCVVQRSIRGIDSFVGCMKKLPLLSDGPCCELTL